MKNMVASGGEYVSGTYTTANIEVVNERDTENYQEQDQEQEKEKETEEDGSTDSKLEFGSRSRSSSGLVPNGSSSDYSSESSLSLSSCMIMCRDGRLYNMGFRGYEGRRAVKRKLGQIGEQEGTRAAA